MPEYISSFTTGFGEIAAGALPRLLPGAETLGVYDGLIYYAYPGNPKNINQVPCFNNSYCVLQLFQGKSFQRMVNEIASTSLRYPVPEGTFRVRFIRGNQFAGVDRQLSLRAEAAVMKTSRLRLDRLNPTTELWYVVRDEGFGFYGQLLRKREATEKTLHPGELRPEFAYLMCQCGNPTAQCVILDPFAGYGSIPAQLLGHFAFGKLHVSDSDPGKVKSLKQALPKDDRVQVSREDALALTGAADASVDLIVTDPPWGYYEPIEDISLFYEAVLGEFARVLQPGGKAVILSARKEEFSCAVENSGLFAIDMTIHTLVNGKKAGVYVLAKTEV